MDDWDLLRQYASMGSHEAFATLVTRYVDFVYSAALRQMGDRHLAEDVTQGVFIVLSQRPLIWHGSERGYWPDGYSKSSALPAPTRLRPINVAADTRPRAFR